MTPAPSTAKTVQEIFARLRAEFGENAVLGLFEPKAGDSYLSIAPEAIERVAAFLHEDAELFFNSLMCLGGVHEQGDQPALVVVYNLHSMRHRHRVTLHVRVPMEKPIVKSVQHIWAGANWFEREAYDLLGIQFENHPDLRRLLLPPDWTGHPLRKDYEYPKEYNGISCVRAKLK